MYGADLEWPAYGYGESSLGMSDVKVDKLGQLWTLDRGGRLWADRDVERRIPSDVLRCWSPSGDLLRTMGAGLFVMPHSVTPCDDGVLVTDAGLHQLFRLNLQGKVEWSLGEPGFPSEELDGFNQPTDVVVSEDGSFFVSDGYGNARILKFNKDRSLAFAWGNRGRDAGQFRLPHSLDIVEGHTVLVADRENSRIQMFGLNGVHLKTIESTRLGKPFGVCAQGRRIYVADNGFPLEKRAGVSIYDLDDNQTHRFSTFGKGPGEMLAPHGIAVDSRQSIYVADVARGLLKFTLN